MKLRKLKKAINIFFGKKGKFLYRDNSYFNKNDSYVVYDPKFKKIFTFKVEFLNGNWFAVSDYHLNYKMTSVKTVELNELIEWN